MAELENGELPQGCLVVFQGNSLIQDPGSTVETGYPFEPDSSPGRGGT